MAEGTSPATQFNAVAGEQHRVEAAEGRAKLDAMVAELLDMSRRFDAYRARPFWQRLVG